MRCLLPVTFVALQLEARELRGSFSAFSLGTTLHF